MVRHLVATLTVVLTASACSSESVTVAAPATTAPPTSATTDPPVESAASQPSATAAMTPRECKDAAADSTGVMDLSSARLLQRPEGIVATYSWSGRTPRTGSVLWVITASRADGSGTRQLGYKIVDAVESAHFVFDFGTSQQANDVGTVTLAAQTLTATFPASAVADLGDGWTWKADLNVAGDDVDECIPT